VLCANPAVALWLGPEATLSAGVLWANAAWLVLQANGIVLAMFLNGAGVVRFQVVQALCFGLLAFGLKLLLASPFGAAGIVWATVVAYVATVLPFYLWFIRRWLARADWA
jgi:O-antigen/teichoic acid export membrane protein